MSRSCESTCTHSLEVDYLNEKYREVMSHNSALREQLNSRKLQDPVKYLKLCEELTKERNELKQQLTESEFEVNQVLSERDTVLKENQSLFDKNDSLRKELEKVLKSRDEYIKENEGLKKKLGVLIQSNDELLSLEVANQEIDQLKKLIEKIKSEAAKAMQESEIAKGRRDWAISEREKIVHERDSVRNLCDELRKERDTATSKLLAAIRDKDEAFKKIEQLNEKIDVLSNTKKSFDNHGYHKKQRMDSEDEIEVDVSHMLVNADLGLTLDCGNENTDYNGNSFYPQVVYVEPNSVFYGKLHTNDFIQFINGIDCSTLSQRMLFKTIRTSAPTCKMIVKRSKPILKGIYNVQLQLANNSNHGIIFDTGVYIADIEQNSAAHYEPLISAGDRVLQINDKTVEGLKNSTELNQIIMNIKNNEKLSLKIMKDGKTTNESSATSLNRGWSKMINCSTQTDQNELKRNVENNYNTSVIPFTPSTNIQEADISLFNSISSSSPNSNKSASSKLSGMFQRIRKLANSSSKDNQENDAIAVLDSVLDSQDSLDNNNAQEKGKKLKNKKNIAKSWPRAAMVMHDSGKSHSGTVVFNRKKNRPQLYLISTDDQPTVQDERKELKEKITSEKQKVVNTFFAPPLPPTTASRSSNRNSNPLPITNQFMLRNSAVPPRSTLPSNPTSKSPIYMGTIYEPTSKNYNLKRLSLNLSSANTKSHFQHNSFIPIKTSNSIESPSISKSPLEAPKEDGLDFTTPKMNKYFSNYSNKYDGTSEGDNLSSSGGVSQQDSLNNASIGMIPSHMRMQSVGCGQGSSGLYSSSYLASRYASPLPFPSNDLLPPCHDLNLQSSSLHNSQNSSIDYSFPPKVKSQLSREEMQAFQGITSIGSYQEGISGTFPRNRGNAFRMGANQVGLPIISKSIKISNNSLDYCGTPDRASPMPTFQIQIVEQGRNVNINKRNSLSDYAMGYKPNIGEQRRVHIDKSEKPLGISIRCRNNRGVFVSHVGENSIASQVGLQIGDQLLEFCGINMRSATYDLAAKFLRQCGNSITMVVQYNPEKYDELSTSDENVSRSDDSTPQNSPKVTRSVMSTDSIQNTRMSSLPPQESSHSTGTLRTHRHPIMSPPPISQGKSASFVSSSSNGNHMMPGNTFTLGKEQPRIVYIETRKNPNLGVSLVGGNAYGIFIHSVQKNSIANEVGLRVGDQILEYNGTDLRRATAEYAAFELAKPADKVTAIVQYNIQKFNQAKAKQGDSFYIRVGFDRKVESNKSDLSYAKDEVLELSFNKDDVLYVENTMFNGVSGHWRAWKLDEHGCRLQCGIIPSQMKVEEELRLLGDTVEGDSSSSRRSSTSARRSFFKRIKPQRGSSRDSKELASFSNTHLSLYLEPSVNDDSPMSYQRVERLDYKYRPVLVIGALSEWVVDKMIIDFPEQFHRCIVSQMRCSKEEIEMRLNNNSIIEYRRRGSLFECVSLQAVKNNKQSHCILDVNLSAVERLHRNQIYPIVLLLKFKSAKQIKEIKESRYGTATMFSTKQAKEMYEHALKLESEYRQYISVVIQGVNITHMSTQIKTAVDAEQEKILWVPTS